MHSPVDCVANERKLNDSIEDLCVLFECEPEHSENEVEQKKCLLSSAVNFALNKLHCDLDNHKYRKKMDAKKKILFSPSVKIRWENGKKKMETKKYRVLLSKQKILFFSSLVLMLRFAIEWHE